MSYIVEITIGLLTTAILIIDQQQSSINGPIYISLYFPKYRILVSLKFMKLFMTVLRSILSVKIVEWVLGMSSPFSEH